MDFLSYVLVFFTIITLTIISNSRARKSSKLPPGPFPFPIIGNIFQLGSKPHLSITELSRKYGPIMTLKLGTLTTVVVSSPETHRIVLQKHDLACSSRNVPLAAATLGHDKFSMVYLPVNHQWRKLRKICKEQMFSVSKLDASQGLRREKLQKLYDYVHECSNSGRAVDIGEAAFTTSLNLISATLFSREFAQFNSDASHELKELVGAVFEVVGKPNFADFFPVLRFLDPQGISKKAKVYFEKFFAIFDEIIDEKMKNGSRIEKNDLVETLIEINERDENELSRNDIRHLLLDLILAGTDTTTGTVEWAMAELLRNPDMMSKARNEIIDLVGTNGRQIQEIDIPKLPYLQAVVKETFRLHPVGPFLIPHKAETEVEINGYVVPKNAQIFVNMWASGRDSNVWSDPDSFLPERFLSGDMESRAKDFEFIPFGAGRRMCPGLPLAHRMLHLTMATLIHNFEWKLENGMKTEDMDMSEKFGLTLEKAVSLKAIPIKV